MWNPKKGLVGGGQKSDGGESMVQNSRVLYVGLDLLLVQLLGGLLYCVGSDVLSNNSGKAESPTQVRSI